jgi:phosphoglycerol transferase MdoB-like AlkP superfamily enzyme
MLKRILTVAMILLSIHFVLRCCFWIYNRALFPGAYPHELGWIFARGFQQDWIGLLIANMPTVLLLTLIAWIKRPATRKSIIAIAGAMFIACNILAIALNCIDIGYFKFGRHRANLDLDFVLADSLRSFKSVLTGYWPIMLIFVALGIVIIKLAGYLPIRESLSSRLSLFLQQLALWAFLLLSTGLPGRPIIPATPLLSVSAASLPLAQNSLSTYAYSCMHRSHELTPVDYFSSGELAQIVQTTHQLSPDTTRRFQKKNVMVFILESFSRCYLIPGDPGRANTPFFDSLLGKSLFFSNAFANGYTSNQGIVSILGGMPALMEEPFYYSEYANTPLKSLGNILKAQGYNTNFLMGAPRDHFGFGKFARISGVDHTYWEDDFNDDRFYDGNWGIFDEPFLQYGAGRFSDSMQPFLAVFFTISAHPPYTIPAEYRSRFAFPDKTPAQRAISYTDFAFRQFFAACRNKPWFRNTLFVFCADHWLDPGIGNGQTSCLNAFTIPIFIYDPANDTGRRRSTVAGQVDVAPTVLDMLGYRGSYTGFGHSLIDTSIADADRYVVNKNGANYQVITDQYIYGYDPVRGKGSYLYRYKTDSACRNDLLTDTSAYPDRKELEKLIKANIQCYRQGLIRRSLE